MTGRNRGTSRAAKNTLSLSMILGTVLVPLSAVAAIWLSDPGQVAEAETTPSTTTPVATTVQQTAVFDTAGATEADLKAACGYVGMTLVDAERNGTISDVQQAALDALRDICDEQGLSLPAAPTPEAQVQTVVVQDDSSNTTTTTTTPPTTTTPSVDDEGEHHEDDEYEGEHENESEHEGDEVEVGE
jgi:hypothetical protein